MNELPSVSRTDPNIKLRLYVMMFLQYFVQGCYLPIISVYVRDALGFSSWQIGVFTSALAVGPLVAPFILGQLVDRYFPTQWVLAGCHLLAAVLMLVLYTQNEYYTVLVLATLYSTVYFPTLMLTNALTFHHLKDRAREFPLIRVWGTIGFVIPAWVIELYFLSGLEGAELNQARGVALLLSGVVELALVIYCLSLPSTPPQPAATGKFAPGVVLSMLRRRDFLVLVSIGLFIGICHKFFFVWNSPFLRWFLSSYGYEAAAEQRISSIGQISEIFVMAALGWMIARMGFKWTLTLGAAAYLLRCLIFAFIYTFEGSFALASAIVYLGQALHGLCFGCFWAVGFIYVDKVAPPDTRGSMQTFVGTFIFSAGMFLGGFFSGGVGEVYTVVNQEQSQAITAASNVGLASSPGGQASILTGSALYPGKGAAYVKHDWQMIWLSCAGLATLSMLAFILLFPQRPDRASEVG